MSVAAGNPEMDLLREANALVEDIRQGQDPRGDFLLSVAPDTEPEPEPEPADESPFLPSVSWPADDEPDAKPAGRHRLNKGGDRHQNSLRETREGSGVGRMPRCVLRARRYASVELLVSCAAMWLFAYGYPLASWAVIDAALVGLCALFSPPSVAFYSVVAQVVPVLLLVVAYEFRAFDPRVVMMNDPEWYRARLSEQKRLPLARGWSVAGLTSVIVGEAAALFAIAYDSSNALTLGLVLGCFVRLLWSLVAGALRPKQHP